MRLGFQGSKEEFRALRERIKIEILFSAAHTSVELYDGYILSVNERFTREHIHAIGQIRSKFPAIPLFIIAQNPCKFSTSDLSRYGISDYFNWKDPDLEIKLKFGMEKFQEIRNLEIARQQLEELNRKLLQENEELQKIASTDALTGIMNRRQGMYFLEREWQRSIRNGQSLALILADIDFFKKYNDSLGHQAGDDCITQVARCLQSSLKRPSDLVFRYGGEEFLILLPCTDNEGARLVGFHILEAIRDLEIHHPDSEASDRVTISLGYAAAVPGIHSHYAELLNKADQGLYRAKNEGRNTISSTTHSRKLEMSA
jgi:two-component system chemotaxis family response regulator WspR